MVFACHFRLAADFGPDTTAVAGSTAAADSLAVAGPSRIAARPVAAARTAAGRSTDRLKIDTDPVFALKASLTPCCSWCNTAGRKPAALCN